MKLYLISQTENIDYDTYDSAVVCAPDEDTARHIHPDGVELVRGEWDDPYRSWCRSPKSVTVEYIGEAADGVEVGVVCAGFNAG